MRDSSISLSFGGAKPFVVPWPSGGPGRSFVPPQPQADLARRVAEALENPLEFPALRQAVVPGDRIVIVFDQRVPQGEILLAGVVEVLGTAGVEAKDILVLQPADTRAQRARDPRSALPKEIATQVQWKVHDPTIEAENAYLASTAGGERIYLAKDVLDADFVLIIGVTGFDPVLGYRGTGSAVYPGLSNTETLRKAIGQGHDELGPDDTRPIRQVIDEVQWLMGLQFVVQVIPGAGGMAGAVFAGQAEAVLREARETLKRDWQIEAGPRSELVIVAIDEPAPRQSWFEIGAALDAARKLVSKDGRIVVLSQLQADLSEGMEILREAHKPRDAIKPLRERQPVDLIPATQIAQALDWANVYLLSRLPGDTVEDLCMVPLVDIEEASRLIEGTDEGIAIAAAQSVSVNLAK